VARDRQRAKQRRAKRRPGAGGPAAGSASSRARDIGLDQAEADDAGLGNTTPPEPTKHALPDVEQARLAEAGVGGDPLIDDETDVDSAPDEIEGDLVPAGRVDPAVAEERAAAGHRRRRRGRVITFLGHCIDELRRVQWPDRRHVGQGTAVVLGFVVLAGGYLGLLDAIWKPIIEAIL
jgi:preprotein translocase SecE subunit